MDLANKQTGSSQFFFLTESTNVYVDLLVVVKSVKPAKMIKTKTGKKFIFIQLLFGHFITLQA